LQGALESLPQRTNKPTRRTEGAARSKEAGIDAREGMGSRIQVIRPGADISRSMRKGLLKKHAVAKSRKEQESEMWTSSDNESEMSVVEGEVVEGAAAPSIPDVQACQGLLQDDETHRAAGRRHGETWTPTFRRVEEVIEPVGLETGRVRDQYRVQSQGLLRDRGLRYLTAKRLSLVASQDLPLTQGHQRSNARGCEIVPFRP
jgi:hypothetical protein